MSEVKNKLKEIGEQLATQNNRMTANPMFCVQMQVCDMGYDASYCEDLCWYNSEAMEVVFENPNDDENWEECGYKLRWETVMVAFTEKGCEEYLELDGHNVKRQAHNGEVRIYANSFNRCPEMIAVRDYLLEIQNETN